MLRACFSKAHLRAYTAYTDCSQCTRSSCSDIKLSLTEHILIICTSVRSCTVLFQTRTLLKFGRTIFNLLSSLKDNDYVAALLGLNPTLDKEVLGNYDTFYKHVALLIHAIWTCYKYFLQL